MQLSESRYFAKFARPQPRWFSDLVAIRERFFNNPRANALPEIAINSRCLRKAYG
jgi:hypothetical protein